MPKTKISEFSATPGNNTDIDGINIAEGCAPSGINDAIRELMAQLKDFQAGTAGDSFNGPIGSTTPAAGTFTNLSASGTFALTGDQVQISEGGTGQTTANAAFNALAPSQTSNAGKYLKTDGTNTSWDALDISTADITGTLPIANGGTGLTALGTGVQTALGQNVTGSGGIVLASSPSLTTPNLGTPSAVTLTNATGLPLSTGVTGTLGTTNGGTGLTSFTANGVVYASSSSALTTGSALTFDGTNSYLGIGPGVTPTKSLTIYNPSIDTEIRLQTGTKNFYLSQRNASGQVDYIVVDNAAQTWSVNNTEGMRLTSTGLGIGTSSPVSKLDVKKTSNDTVSRTNSVGAFGDWDSLGAGLLMQQTLSSPYGFALQAANASNSVQFPLLLNPSGGNVGIGTSSPAYKLDVAGSVIRLINSGATADLFLTDSGTTNGYVRLRGESNALKFITGNGISATLDTSGNLGLGVTPSAWSSSFYKAIEGGDANSQGAIAFNLSGTSNGVDLWSNGYFDGTNSIYKYSATAGLYQVAGNVHRWYNAPSGTAGDPISFTQAMTLDASGNLLVGTTSSTYNSAGRGVIELNGTSDNIFAMKVAGAQNFYLQSNATNTAVWNVANTYMSFGTNNTERARITSGGDFQVNASGSDPYSSSSGSGISLNNANYIAAARSGGACLYIARQTSDGDVTEIWRGGTKVGSISVTTTATAYNTSSDYRLKNITGSVTGSGAFIDALKPKVGTWKADGSKFVGFLAHEVQEVSPGSVVGTKDAVDAEGKPIMQAMEYGSAEFIANIIAELQSLRARVAQLEAK